MRPHRCPGEPGKDGDKGDKGDPDTRIYEVDLDGHDYGHDTPPGGEAA